MNGETHRIDETYFEVHLQEKPDTVAQRDGQLLLVLDTQITPELRSEGWRARWSTACSPSASSSIWTTPRASPCATTRRASWRTPSTAHHEYIARETLADTLELAANLAGGAEEAVIYEMPFRFTATPV